MVDSLELDPSALSVIHSPVGIQIGAKTAEEVALSVLAEVTKAIRVDGLTAPKAEPLAAPIETIDPICGMTVVVGEDTPHLRHDDTDYWYCNVGCRTRHSEELAAS